MLTALRPTQDTIDLVAGLGGTWHGSYALCRCPAHNDRTPSLSIRQGHRGILVHCFAGCSNEDVLRELSRAKPIRNSTPPDYKHHASRANAIRIWEQGRPIDNTIADVYRRARHLSAPLEDVRFHPRCPFGRKPNAQFIPAMLIAVRDGQDITAIQRIKLKEDGSSHLGKMMLGHPGAAAWAPRLKGKVLALAESMEDAGAYSRIHGMPCWSSLGAERLPLVRIPSHVERLVIAEDNNRAGRLGSLAAVAAHSTEHRTVIRHAPPARWGDWSAYLDHMVRTQRQ